MTTAPAPNPTEPDWSPDGKWIAFTSQTGDFNICVMSADGSISRRFWSRARTRRGRPTRARSFSRGAWAADTRYLCLTFFTKQVKDMATQYREAIPSRLGEII